MKSTLSILLSFLVTTSIILSGCKKEEETTPTNNNNGVSITFSDAYGIMAAVTSVSYSTVGGILVPVNINTATAVFATTSGSSTSYTDAGAVTLNGKTLTKQSNNAYVYQNTIDPLTFPPVTWNVAGSSSVPAINYTDDKPMPGYTGYNGIPASITKSKGITISLGSLVSDADSIYVIITGGNNSMVFKRVGGNASGATFSAKDLSSLGTTSTGMIQVTPWNYKSEDFNDKAYYFVNETAYSKIGVAIN